MKYSDFIAEWLAELGYTHCFCVGGGNIMHLIESLSRTLQCHAVVNEVAAGIAAEYFNETGNGRKALALVTAGPGLTNIVTAMAGAFLESRELLVIGGQVKTADLAHGQLRQRGIQEIDGVSIARPISKKSVLFTEPLDRATFQSLVLESRTGRKGPVFLEIPLDVQGRRWTDPQQTPVVHEPALAQASDKQIAHLASKLRNAKRPVILLGGGIQRTVATAMEEKLSAIGIPITTTWNAADRIDAANPVYMGRPNTWGQRSANLILQQADVLLALGTRLGMQQTGFNWQAFVPGGDVIQVDIDPAELQKGHPHVAHSLCADANIILTRLTSCDLGNHSQWLTYARNVRQRLPLIEPVNHTGPQYLSPYEFVDQLSDLCNSDDIVIPCSSGGAFTVMMQTFRQKRGQLIVTDKGLASMGYGLSGAIGAAFAHPERRTVLVEGDGGFAQNMQEIGTAQINALNLKMFIFDDAGYASIRMTQKSYFGGRYVGCDTNTGLGLPQWERLFSAWDISVCRLGPGYRNYPRFETLFTAPGPAAFIVSIDPEQTYLPKITSQIMSSGAMASNPLHRMTPELPPELIAEVGQFLPA